MLQYLTVCGRFKLYLCICQKQTFVSHSRIPIVILLLWRNVVSIVFKYLHFLQSICQPTNSLHKIQFITGTKLLHALACFGARY